MPKVIKMNSPLVTQPLKTSPGTGATLASLGFNKNIPLMHGAQGCSAFTKIYLIGHLREPIPLQNTAIDQVAAVMGGDENLASALALLCKKHEPELITVLTTGLTEMQGTDTFRVVMDFKKSHPEYAATRVVTMSTPDFSGSMQSGFACAVDNVVRQLTLPPSGVLRQRKRVNVLCSVGMTSADIETMKRYVEAFDLDSIVVPDLSLSLDGHLADTDFSPTSTGGTSVLEVELMADSVATLAIGGSMLPTAKWLQKRFHIPYILTEMGMGIEAMDELVLALADISGKPVPEWITRERKRLQDAMVDTHFVLTQESVVLGLEPDLAIGYSTLLAGCGVEISRVVTTIEQPGLSELPAAQVIIGDLSQLVARDEHPAAVISNSHAALICEPLGIAVLRAGYPCHDYYGNMDIRQFGYEGSRERLFALANITGRSHENEVTPHVSVYRFSAQEVTRKEVAS